MEEREEHNLKVLLNGKPIGSVNKIYSMTCQVEGPVPDWLRNFQLEGEARRKEMEATWRQLPEQTRKAAQEAAHLLGSLLYRIGAHSLSIDAMAEGKPHTLTITLNKKNAD